MNQKSFEERYLGTASDGSPFTIRRAVPADRQAIVAGINSICAEQVFYESNEYVPTPAWEAMLDGRGLDSMPCLLTVVDLQNTLIGHGRVSPAGFGHKDRHVANIGIGLLKPYRELKIGTTLLEYMIRWANANRYKKLTASVFSTNQRALNLFYHFGFVQEGLRRKQFEIEGEYVDEILVGRFLDHDTR